MSYAQMPRIHTVERIKHTNVVQLKWTKNSRTFFFLDNTYSNTGSISFGKYYFYLSDISPTKCTGLACAGATSFNIMVEICF